MPSMGFFSESLSQNDGDEGDEEGEAELFKSCLTPEQAEYDMFDMPGMAKGMGNNIAKNSEPNWEDFDEEEQEELFQPAEEIAEMYKKEQLSEKEVLGELVAEYGCEPVKEYVQQGLERLEEGTHPVQKMRDKHKAMKRLGFMPDDDEDEDESGGGDLSDDAVDKIADKLMDKMNN